MNERLPYEDQLIQELEKLPLPDENLAWGDMERRLDEDDDQRPVIWWKRYGCLLSGLLLLTLFGIGWLILKPGQWFNKEKETVSAVKPENINPLVEDSGGLSNSTAYKISNESLLPDTNRMDDSNRVKETLTELNETNIPINATNKEPLFPVLRKPSKIKGDRISAVAENKSVIYRESGKSEKDNPLLPPPETEKKNSETVSVNRSDDGLRSEKNVQTVFKDSLIVNDDEKQEKNIVAKKPADTTTNTPVNSSQKMPEKSNSKNKGAQSLYTWFAGLSFHQQLPVAGQKIVPYSSSGRKSGIADYIPAIYLRLAKNRKWFLQAEFRYGAPQYTKEFVFRQANIPDTGAFPQFTTVKSSSLKKTFYHQLPFTFHYYILPRWSLGAGVQWNKFGGAVYEQQDFKRNNLTQQDSLFSKKILAESSDSLYEFKKSYFQAAIETQYQLRRFSFGARYAFGLEPYIKFSLPGGVNQEERNNAVQVFIRYQLWKSSKNN